MRSSDQLFTGTEVMSFTALEYTHSTTKSIILLNVIT